MVGRERFRWMIYGMLLSALLISCVSATFPYKYYAYDIRGHKLIGATPADDIEDSACYARQGNASPCMIVLTDEFYNLKADYLKTKDALIRCEKK